MNLKIGDIVEGKVTKLIKIGAFVDIDNGKTGFIHISELSHNFINLPSDILNLNDIIKVKIINITDDKISLSIKQLSCKSDCSKNKESSFEDMMKKFKNSSDQKLSDLKKYLDNKRGKSKNKY